jgi:glycogen debranching enzyme
VGPRGERLEVVGRAPAVVPAPPPYTPAEAREELLVVKQGDIFLCARPDGDIHPARVSGEGLYAHDTRYLSELRLTLDGTAPVALSYAADRGFRAVVDATNATLENDGHISVPQQTLGLQRSIVIDERLYHLVRLRSYCRVAVSTPVAAVLGADFADMFEVRGGLRRDARGHLLATRQLDRGPALAYLGEDDELRETLIEFDPPPDETTLDTDHVRAMWQVALAPGEERELLIVVEPSLGGGRRRRRRMGTAVGRLSRASREWERACTATESDSERVDELLRGSLRDLRALLTPTPGGEMPAAGIPWYVAPFGRDSLLTAYQALPVNPALARTTLLALARLQAEADDLWRDAEPGKILHELRSGELARAGLIPHTPYYGTVDATPLYLILAAAYHRWTGDLETLAGLRPVIDAAVMWIRDHGDRDGDGFVEYECRSPGGLRNQGWKDSHDSVMHSDGALAEGPIALIEVQGYVYRAKMDIADVYEALGEADIAAELRAEAEVLRGAINDAYWMPDEGTFALALDGRKRQVASVTSNPGHCLWCGVVDEPKAGSVAERLMASDMFSGWGVRTLSSESPAYNPMSYHNGSVWPHDNAIAAAGLKRYGFVDATERIASALFEVGSAARDSRLPELYCGFDRSETNAVVAYPVACIPQGWAAGAPFMLLEAMLGISANAPAGLLTLDKPRLPSWINRLEIRGMRVGAAVLTLAFERDRGITGFSLLEQKGRLNVVMSA